jgi:hypothetical protein
METEVAQDSIVTVTESAAQQIAAMLASDSENAGKSLRVFVEGGGCSGMQYGMVFDVRMTWAPNSTGWVWSSTRFPPITCVARSLISAMP